MPAIKGMHRFSTCSNMVHYMGRLWVDLLNIFTTWILFGNTEARKKFVDQSATWQSRLIAAPNHFEALFFSCKFLPRPCVTGEKAISCLKSSKLIVSKLLCDFKFILLFAICGIPAIYGYLAIFIAIYGDFVIVCDIYCDLWRFCNIFKFFSFVFVFVCLFVCLFFANYRFFPSDTGPRKKFARKEIMLRNDSERQWDDSARLRFGMVDNFFTGFSVPE